MKVLLAIEDELTGAAIADYAINNLFFGAEYTVLNIIPPITAYVSFAVIPELMSELRRESQTEGLQLVRHIALKLRDKLHSTSVHELVAEGPPTEMIPSIARDINADLIVVASHGKQGLAGLLGSVSTHVAATADCPVLVISPIDQGNGHVTASKETATSTC
jgi:universal stress protein A